MVQVWVRFVIPPLPEVLIKCHNLMNCANLAVLTRMQHPYGLVTVDFNVSVGGISHNTVLKTPKLTKLSSTVTI